MGFQRLKAEFERDITREAATSQRINMEEGSPLFRYWLLRLLFEIAGNLDSLVVTNRNSEKHIDRMATAYTELIQLQKDRAQK